MRLVERFSKLTGSDKVIASPSVYEEAVEMLTGALVIYTFSELRTMAKDGVIKDLLEPPFSAKTTLEIIENNKQALNDRATDHEDLKERLQALHQLQSHRRDFLSGMVGNFFGSGSKTDSITVTHFEDDRADKELVHAIVVNRVRQRVTIVFRGSVTSKDFLQDAKCVQKKVPNPYTSGPDVPEKMNLHTGFYQYLLKKDADGKSRYDSIMEQARQQLEKCPGYSLYVTGHSLGGALACICGVYAASDDTLVPELAKRVVVYSIASPFCGNWRFRHIHYELERQGRLRHLRIANQEDLVTLLPFVSLKAGAVSPALAAVSGVANLYKHVGMQLQFKTNGDKVEHLFSYPKENDCEDDADYAKELERTLESGKHVLQALYCLLRSDFATIKEHHSCDEYERRLEQVRADLTSVSLDELYTMQSIVGNIFRQDYQPKARAGAFSRAKRAFSALRSKQKKEDSADQLSLAQAAELCG